ncbi:MAG: MBL fold metallo-hydrolase [Solirubrobacterales bacterium]
MNQCVDWMTVTVLVDNLKPGFQSPLQSQHGLSLLVDCAAKGRCWRILFDVGPDADLLLHNMRHLDIDPESVDLIVLSHAHSDHCGALLPVLARIGRKTPVLCHPNVLSNAAFLNGPKAIEQAGGQPIGVRSAYRILGGVWLSGEIPNQESFAAEDGAAAPTPSLAEDDLALFANLSQSGLVIVTGCAHAGLVSTILHCMALTGKPSVHAVLGGFHLGNHSSEEIDAILNELEQGGVRFLFPGHCTGFEAAARMYRRFPKAVHLLHVGRTMHFGRPYQDDYRGGNSKCRLPF